MRRRRRRWPLGQDSRLPPVTPSSPHLAPTSYLVGVPAGGGEGGGGSGGGGAAGAAARAGAAGTAAARAPPPPPSPTAAARAAAAGTAAARAGVAAANFVVQCSYLENHGHFVVHSVRTHSVWLKRTESEHYYTPRRPLYTAIWRMYVSAPPATPMADIRHAHLCSHSLACLGPA